MSKSVLVTPLYISVAWTLMVSYQLFTEAAVTTVLTYFSTFWPSAGAWLASRIDMIVFVYAFAWVFVLSSVIPSVILGKERSVLVQFLVCMALTFVAFVIQDALASYGGGAVDKIFSLVELFRNPFIALGYLLVPYLFMLVLDIRARGKRREMEKLLGSDLS